MQMPLLFLARVLSCFLFLISDYSTLARSVAEQGNLSLTWSEISRTGFLDKASFYSNKHEE